MQWRTSTHLSPGIRTVTPYLTFPRFDLLIFCCQVTPYRISDTNFELCKHPLQVTPYRMGCPGNRLEQRLGPEIWPIFQGLLRNVHLLDFSLNCLLPGITALHQFVTLSSPASTAASSERSDLCDICIFDCDTQSLKHMKLMVFLNLKLISCSSTVPIKIFSYNIKLSKKYFFLQGWPESTSFWVPFLSEI